MLLHSKMFELRSRKDETFWYAHSVQGMHDWVHITHDERKNMARKLVSTCCTEDRKGCKLIRWHIYLRHEGFIWRPFIKRLAQAMFVVRTENGIVTAHNLFERKGMD